jgi:hypothetical protein
MLKIRQFALVLSSAAVLAACDGFKEAMTAHVDVVARAGSQELSVTRLAELLGGSKLPLNKDVAKGIAGVWVDYQLLAEAAARGDSLNDPKVIDEAMWAQISNARAQKWYEAVSKTWPTDTMASEAKYNQGDLLAGSHILFMVPKEGLTAASQAAIKKTADSVRRVVTPKNFATLAGKFSQDPGSREKGGYLGVFPRGIMVPEFEKGLTALKPGEISPVIRSDFGYHIIMRAPYSEVKADFASQLGDRATVVAESLYLAKLEAAGNIQVKPGMAATVKEVARNMSENRHNKTVLATSTAGPFTAGRLTQWLAAFPPQARVATMIQQQPDSSIEGFVKNLVKNELVLRQADSAKVAIDTAELTAIRNVFTGTLYSAWNEIGISPDKLSDSARTASAKASLASQRVETYMEALIFNNARFVQVTPALEGVLFDKYEHKINEAGLDRALERAAKVRAALDSTRAQQQQQQGPSAVPMPSMGPPGQQRPAPRPAAPTPAPTKKP